MEEYSERSDDLFTAPGLKVFEAESRLYRKRVLVKEYRLENIYSSEGLLKEAIRLAQEKPQESALLIGVLLSRDYVSLSLDACYVTFTLEKRNQVVARDLIERDDRTRHCGSGHAGYEFIKTIYARDQKKVDVSRSKSLGKNVIIKSLECDWANEANILLKEAFVLATVEHQNICLLIDIYISQESDNKFRINLVLEELPSDVKKNIEHRKKIDKRYSEEELVSFLRDVTCALAHAKIFVRFMKGIAHRDIKPANIFITADGKYKIGDFDAAWLRTDSTMTRSAIGTNLHWS